MDALRDDVDTLLELFAPQIRGDVRSYLNQHPSIVAVLPDVFMRLLEGVDRKGSLLLRMSRDPEDGSQSLHVALLTALSPEEVHPRRRRFHQWWAPTWASLHGSMSAGIDYL